MKRFRATRVAGEELRTSEFTRRSEQAVRDSLASWWGRICADFEIIEIVEVA